MKNNPELFEIGNLGKKKPLPKNLPKDIDYSISKIEEYIEPKTEEYTIPESSQKKFKEYVERQAYTIFQKNNNNNMKFKSTAEAPHILQVMPINSNREIATLTFKEISTKESNFDELANYVEIKAASIMEKNIQFLANINKKDRADLEQVFGKNNGPFPNVEILNNGDLPKDRYSIALVQNGPYNYIDRSTGNFDTKRIIETSLNLEKLKQSANEDFKKSFKDMFDKKYDKVSRLNLQQSATTLNTLREAGLVQVSKEDLPKVIYWANQAVINPPYKDTENDNKPKDVSR